MHEISLVRNVFRTLKDQFPPEELAKISAIRLKIGLLANVEPVLLQNAFQAVVETDEPGFRLTALEIEMVPIVIECPGCGKQSTVEQYRFRCAHCDTPTNNIVTGTELMISGVEMENEPATPDPATS